MVARRPFLPIDHRPKTIDHRPSQRHQPCRCDHHEGEKSRRSRRLQRGARRRGCSFCAARATGIQHRCQSEEPAGSSVESCCTADCGRVWSADGSARCDLPRTRARIGVGDASPSAEGDQAKVHFVSGARRAVREVHNDRQETVSMDSSSTGIRLAKSRLIESTDGRRVSEISCVGIA
jgi:hypothetical protein